MGMDMGIHFENLTGMDMGMGMSIEMTFENKYECRYSYTCPKLTPRHP